MTAAEVSVAAAGAREAIAALRLIRPHTHAIRIAVHCQVRVLRALLFGGPANRRHTDHHSSNP
jgi:hypothetical protein